MPPQTHSGSTKEVLQNIIEPNRKWFENYLDRLGNLYIYVNGYRFMTIENFEEIIPHELNTEKEKQLGVPFNISLGGGTQGLRESLVFSGCSGLTGPYIQDPELMPNQTLSGTSLSGLTTDIVMEPNFGGTFMGAISQFRMYVEPLSAPQIQHNFRLLKDRFSLFDFWCPECESCLVTPTPTPSITPTISVTPSVSISSSLTPTPTTTPTITPSNTQTPTPTPTNTSFSCNLVVSGRIDTSLTPTPTTTPTPTPQPNCELIIISSVSNINDYTLDMGVSYNSGSTIATYTFTASTNLPQTTIIDFTNEIYKNDGTSILINSSVTINKNERIGSNVVVISDLDYSDIRPYELSYSGVSSIGVDFNVINKTSRVYYDRVDTPLWVQYIFRDCCGLLDDIIGFVSESALNTWILNGFGVEYDRNCYVPSRLNTEPGPVVGYFYGPDFKTCDKKPKTCLPCPQPTPTPTPTRTTIGYTAKQMCCQNLCTYESDIPNTGGICDDNQSEYVIRRLTGPVNMINKYVYYDLPYGLSSCYKITDIEPYPPQLYEEYTSGLFPIYSGDFYDTCEECFENNPTNVPCVMGYRWAIFKSCCKEPLENEGIINNDFLGEEYVGYYVVMAKVSENLALFLDERLSYTEPASDYQSLFNGLTTLSKVHPNYIPAQEMGNVFSNGTQGDVEFYTRCIKFQEFVSEEYVNNFTDGLNGLNINSNYLFVSNNYPICTFNYGFNYWGLDPFFYSCCTCECNPMYLDLQQQTEEYINVVGLNCCEYTYQWFTIPVPSDTVIEVGMIFTNNTVYSNNLCWFVYSVEPEVPFRFPNIGSLTPYTSCDECCSGPSQIESNCTCEP
jgi:hypothetical protein